MIVYGNIYFLSQHARYRRWCFESELCGLWSQCTIQSMSWFLQLLLSGLYNNMSQMEDNVAFRNYYLIITRNTSFWLRAVEIDQINSKIQSIEGKSLVCWFTVDFLKYIGFKYEGYMIFIVICLALARQFNAVGQLLDSTRGS